MHAWETIQNSLEYIEEHLTEEISTEKLADTVGLSPFYFQRLFRRLVRKPVREYIKLRRLARMLDVLKNPGRKLLDISLDYGFSSHANFTRAFKATYHITPEEYRATLPMLNVFEKPDLSMSYTMIDEGVPLIVGNIVLEITRQALALPEIFLGLETKADISEQTPAGESTGIDVPGQLWNRYHAEKETMAVDFVEDIELGMSHSADPAHGTFTYFAGGLVKAIPEQIQKGVVKQELLPGEYVVCRIEGESFQQLVPAALNQALKYIFEVWLPHHNLTTQPFSAEKYYRCAKDMACMELWVMPLPYPKK